jgi:uncharacterized protein (DUF2249 family)
MLNSAEAGESLGGAMVPEIDLREHAMSCADSTTQAFDRLAVNDGFVFVADHDPTALRYLFEAERAGQFTWEPLAEDDNGVWRVRVSRVTAAPNPGAVSSASRPGRYPVTGAGARRQRG